MTVAKGTLTILAPGAGPGINYVKSVTFNGIAIAHPWIRHADLAAGGVLAFEMSPTATTWGADFGTP